jgi:cell division protein FtsQ
VVVELPSSKQTKYSFPVIAGMGDAEPLSTRAARMKIYNTLVRELDSEGGNYSAGLSEVDLSDADDVKVTVADPAGAVLVHLGSGSFLARYKVYLAHVQEWRQQFQKLESVDLRYDRQVIVNPDQRQAAPPVSKPAPKAAAPRRAARGKKRK